MGAIAVSLVKRRKLADGEIDVVAAFNSRVVGRESVAPIEKDDVHSGNAAAGTADNSPVVLSPAESELHRRWFTLEFGKQNEGLSNEQKTDPESIASFDKYLDDIADLKPSTGESDAEVLQRKCGLMHQAVMVAPPGPLTDLWSLGACTFAAMTARIPFEGDVLGDIVTVLV